MAAVPDVIEVAVVTHDDSARLKFRMKRSGNIGKAMKAFCQKQGLELDAMEFVFNDRLLQPSDTLASIGFEEGNEIVCRPKTDADHDEDSPPNVPTANESVCNGAASVAESGASSGDRTMRTSRVISPPGVPGRHPSGAAPPRVPVGPTDGGGDDHDETNNNDDEDAELNVKVQDQNGSVLNFRIRRNVPLKKVMSAYCERKRLEPFSVRFLFDGNRVHPENTAQDKGMEDGDVLEVVSEQQGG